MSKPPPINFPTRPIAGPNGPSRAASGARKAAFMMWILGGLMLFVFVQMLIGIQLMPADQFHHQWEEAIARSQQSPPFSESVFRACMNVFSIMGVLVGITAITLAFGVKRRRRGTIIGSTIITAVIAVGLGLLILGVLAQAAVAPGALAVVPVLLVPLGGMILLLFWLFSALKTDHPVAGFAVMTPQVASTNYPGPLGYSAYRPAPPAPPSILGYGYPGLKPPPPPPPIQPTTPPTSPNEPAASPS